MMIEKNPRFTPEQVKEQITDSIIIDGIQHPTALNINKLCEFLSTLTK